MKDYHKAATCYKKACDLDPNNMGYLRNYHLTLKNLKEMTDEQERQQQQSQGESASMPPNFIDTAARLMTDPEVSSVYVLAQYIHFIIKNFKILILQF